MGASLCREMETIYYMYIQYMMVKDGYVHVQTILQLQTNVGTGLNLANALKKRSNVSSGFLQEVIKINIFHNINKNIPIPVLIHTTL